MKFFYWLKERKKEKEKKKKKKKRKRKERNFKSVVRYACLNAAKASFKD